MEVVAVNIGERRNVNWRGKQVETGIFKTPVEEIMLSSTDVDHDHVVDRRYHGGIDKACYLYSADHYAHFKSLYPNLEWDWGMFGENVTITGLDESQLFIGAKYQLGQALVEISQPREPCFKLGIRFGNQKVLKDFIASSCCGTYVRVLRPGKVKSGDSFELVERGSDSSILDIFNLMYKKHPQPEILPEVLKINELAESAKSGLRRILEG